MRTATLRNEPFSHRYHAKGQEKGSESIIAITHNFADPTCDEMCRTFTYDAWNRLVTKGNATAHYYQPSRVR